MAVGPNPAGLMRIARIKQIKDEMHYKIIREISNISEISIKSLSWANIYHYINNQNDEKAFVYTVCGTAGADGL